MANFIKACRASIPLGIVEPLVYSYVLISYALFRLVTICMLIYIEQWYMRIKNHFTQIRHTKAHCGMVNVMTCG